MAYYNVPNPRAMIQAQFDQLRRDLQASERDRKQLARERSQLVRAVEELDRQRGEAVRELERAVARIEELEASTAPEPSPQTQLTDQVSLDEFDEVSARADALALERDDYKERAVRASADLENMRKRHTRELDQERTSARRKVLNQFLELRDNFERALAASDDPESPWHKGTEGMLRQFDDVLARERMIKIGEVGERFDPALHEALGVAERGEREANVIAEVYRPGFTFADGTLARAAQVIVTR